MPEHIHGCLNCRPEMVPDFDPADSRYHAYPTKCGTTLRATVNGVEPGYHKGVFEGEDGWVLFAGATTDEIHTCPNCTTRDADGFLIGHTVCVEPRFGHVAVIHDCPAGLAARVERLQAALKPLVPEDVYWRAVFGRDVY